MSVGLAETRFADDDGETFGPDGVIDHELRPDDLDVGAGIAQVEGFLREAAPNVRGGKQILMAIHRRAVYAGASRTAMRAAGFGGALGNGRRY